MRLITSPWVEVFDYFGRSIRSQAILVAPFIAKEPLDRLASILDSSNHPKIDLLTNLAVDSLLYGSVDAKGIASFCRQYPDTTVRHLPGLHAKAYVADEDLAIITSGNLTQASLHHNYEYGIQINDIELVQRISRDLQDYSALGSMVSIGELDQLAEIADTLRARHSETLRTARVTAREEFER
jgi:phosphatidylserine/phosphatidylglycerophosphate/cardiolipin synthase-like enzyme